MKVLLLGLFVLLMSFNALAQSMTGQQLLNGLELPNSDPNKLQYVKVVGDITFKWEGQSHCKPEGATVGQAIAITEKFLKANPEIWHMNAYDITGVALGQAWPCKKRQ